VTACTGTGTGTGTGIWLVRAQAEPLGAALQAPLDAVVYRPWQDAVRSQQHQFADAYRQHAQWIIVGATGIAVRFLDGLIADKHTDPAVVVLDEAGRFAISLLAGHEGGANALAYQVAALTGAVPVITTATETVKPLVIGIGCRKDVAHARISAAVMQALGSHSLDLVREIATIDLKQHEPGLLAFCAAHDLPLRVIARETVAARGWVTVPSAWVSQQIGVDGVCEPCALIASPRGKLIVPKTTLDGVAVAIVEDSWSAA
jgi:cobalt-precorrin 5A hydrolase